MYIYIYIYIWAPPDLDGRIPCFLRNPCSWYTSPVIFNFCTRNPCWRPWNMTVFCILLRFHYSTTAKWAFEFQEMSSDLSWVPTVFSKTERANYHLASDPPGAPRAPPSTSTDSPFTLTFEAPL